ncbi:putative DNA-binding domain-containing protein [Pseudoalteromonas sp.]|uniref:HvfC family RiPP maturation protein n=1 Tax=Pseudoalteromonas sp. TaxID=53249 RepID=UPI001BCB57D5|nr:putative DNA-binding domain-containing protein [Pseudoalteromonas sp.]
MRFSDIQNEFIAHIRQPNRAPCPADVEDRRMAIYRELFFNNINGFVSSAFPVLKTLYNDQQWQQLVREFFSEHDCQSPYFLDIAEEFVTYLATSYVPKDFDPLFMLALAHYEWIELDISVIQADPQQIPLTANKLTQSSIYLSKTARNLSYDYPVQHISETFQPQQPSEEPHYFVVYRDQDDEVQFLTTNAMTALLLSIIDNNAGSTFEYICQQVSEQAPQFSFEQITQGALSTLTAMAERQIIVTKNQD